MILPSDPASGLLLVTLRALRHRVTCTMSLATRARRQTAAAPIHTRLARPHQPPTRLRPSPAPAHRANVAAMTMTTSRAMWPRRRTNRNEERRSTRAALHCLPCFQGYSRSALAAYGTVKRLHVVCVPMHESYVFSFPIIHARLMQRLRFHWFASGCWLITIMIHLYHQKAAFVWLCLLGSLFWICAVSDAHSSCARGFFCFLSFICLFIFLSI